MALFTPWNYYSTINPKFPWIPAFQKNEHNNGFSFYFVSGRRRARGVGVVLPLATERKGAIFVAVRQLGSFRLVREKFVRNLKQIEFERIFLFD